MMPSNGSIRMRKRAEKRGSLGVGLRASSVRGVRRQSIVRSGGVNFYNADSAARAVYRAPPASPACRAASYARSCAPRRLTQHRYPACQDTACPVREEPSFGPACSRVVGSPCVRVRSGAQGRPLGGRCANPGSCPRPPGTPRVCGAFLHALRAYQGFGRPDQDGAGRDRVAIWLSGMWNSDNREWGRLLTGAALFVSAAMTGWNHRQRRP
jgi:hypothetical protein